MAEFKQPVGLTNPTFHAILAIRGKRMTQIDIFVLLDGRYALVRVILSRGIHLKDAPIS